ncbi:caspase-8-like isoform X1 [Sparus aurata]|uniref:caspase-8-like isoform X1 n=1 Tax=Sparus aurata TaxID=8175 RepID=UPI0011C1CF9A|nr:caspase-8-like isoform X1 [Sparus aurata]XP_030260073.1 caspase-8-like isoform X1 [Sparus aurata]
MAAKGTIRRNKTAIQATLCADYSLILNKVDEKQLITPREYRNLRSINREDVEGHVVKLVDKIMDKGEDTCKKFLELLQTDEEVKSTYPDLKKIQLTNTSLLPTPVQASSAEHSDGPSPQKRRKEDDQYQLNSRPTGLCVIINNENFTYMNQRRGTNRDARMSQKSLGEVFSWLGFRVLMCKDQTRDQMDQALKCFASLSDLSQLHEFSVQEWSENGFTDIKEAPPSLNHGDAFICCIMSHGESGVVSGSDGKSLPIKHITRTFKATDQSALTGKPKVFLIQACQGKQDHRGVLSEDLQADDCQSQYIPEEADFLVAIATVEDYKSFRHITDGSWFIQSVCQQLKEGCSRGDDMTTILSRVNNEVSKKEGVKQQPGKLKQMPEVKFTLRKRLVLTPHCD